MVVKKSRLRPVHMLIAFSLLISTANAKSMRVYLMGNSLTDNINHEGLQSLAEAAGHTHIKGRHVIPGAPISWIWDHPESGFTFSPFGHYPQALTEYTWDVISLQPFNRKFDSDLEHSQKLIDLAREKSPDVQFVIYSQWVREGDGDYTQLWLADVSEWIRGGDANRPTPQRTKMYYETLTDSLRTLYPGMKPVKMAPVGNVFYLLEKKILAGIIPRFTTVFELIEGTHVNNMGSYVAGLTYFSTIYEQSPIGLPVVDYGPIQGKKTKDYDIDAELAQVLQETVWEVVATHPLSGVTSEEPVKVVTPILTPAVEGNEYREYLLPAFGKPPYSWQITSGQLPEGFILEENGLLRGQSGERGTKTITFQVTDSDGNTHQKQLEFAVVPDTEPNINTAGLDPLHIAEYTNQKITAEGGNGAVVFELTDGELPIGVTLHPDGRLTGAAGEEGDFPVTISAFDSDSDNPDTASQNYNLRVNPLRTSILQIRNINGEGATTDGKLDESFWNLQYKAEKLVRGTTNDNVVRFDAVWVDDRIQIAVEVEDDSVTDGDRVELFIDALYNKEETYNWDDRYVSLDKDGKLANHTGDTFRNRFKSVNKGNKISAEFNISWKNLGFSPSREPMLHRIIGFDVAYVDFDEDSADTTMIVWKGTGNNSTDPSEFGAAWFVTEPSSIIAVQERKTSTPPGLQFRNGRLVIPGVQKPNHFTPLGEVIFLQ